jgi:hypothetical protein
MVTVIGDRMPGLKPLSHWVGPSVTALTMTSGTRVRFVMRIDRAPPNQSAPDGGSSTSPHKAA